MTAQVNDIRENYEKCIRKSIQPHRGIAEYIRDRIKIEPTLNGTKRVRINSSVARMYLEKKGYSYNPRNPLVTNVIRNMISVVLSTTYDSNLAGSSTGYNFNATDEELQILEKLLDTKPDTIS